MAFRLNDSVSIFRTGVPLVELAVLPTGVVWPVTEKSVNLLNKSDEVRNNFTPICLALTMSFLFQLSKLV